VARSTRLSVSMKVVPSHEVKYLAYLYTRAKQLVVNWLVKTKLSFRNDKELIAIIHHECTKTKANGTYHYA